MADKHSSEKVFTGLIKAPPVLLMVLGTVLIVLGVVGGITTPRVDTGVVEPSWRTVSLITGIAFVFVGIVWRAYNDRMRASLPKQLIIRKAVWGADGKYADVTDKLQSLVKLETKATNEDLGVDPIPYTVKTLKVTYTHAGRRTTQSFPEQSNVNLP